jgi:hypothetical protein
VAEPSGRSDGDPQQSGIDIPSKPHDAGIVQGDLQLPVGPGIEHRDWKEGRSRGILGARFGCGSLRKERGGRRCFAEAALPGIERHRTDAVSAAKLGDAEAALLLPLNLAAPPLLPRPAVCRRSESEHEFSPGVDKLDARRADLREEASAAVGATR